MSGSRSDLPDCEVVEMIGERMDLLDAFQLVSQAAVFMAPHGAGLSYMQSMRRGRTLSSCLQQPGQHGLSERLLLRHGRGVGSQLHDHHRAGSTGRCGWTLRGCLALCARCNGATAR